MSYTRPSSGWTSEFQLLDWRALVSLWGLNPANSSGWRFRSADGTEVVLGNDQALARLAAPQSADRFLGRADGLLLGAPAPATGTSPSSTPATNTSNTTPVVQAIIKTADSSSSGNSANPSLPLIVDTTPAAISATPGKIDWLPSWRQLDLELGVAVEADNTFQLLAPASYGLTPRGHQLLVDLQLTGSNDADVVFASAGSSIDLGLGQDTIVSRATDGGANHLYGGGQSDRFFLAAPGDIAYGGSRVAVGDQSTADSAANQFFIDLGARPTGYRDDPRARITIADFQPGLDRLTLIAGDPQQAAPLPISAVNYLEWRNRLAQEQNIQLNAAPQIRLARRGLAITAEMLANGYKLASDFFFTDADLAAGDAPALRLVGYDNSLPWLREVDGALEIAPGSSVAPGSYTLSLAATDGLSRSPVTTITLAVNPTVNIGAVSIPAGSSLRFQFPDIRDSALELLVQTFDENGLPINNPTPVAGQVGNSAGTPVGYNAFGSDAVAGDLFSSGRLAFFLRRADQSSALIPLRIQTSSPTGFDLQAVDGTKVVATISNATAPDVLIGETSFGGVSVLGLFLPIPAGTAQGATRQVSVAVELFREAGFNSNLGFYLADRHTGAVIDSITGALLSAPALDDKDNPNPDYNAIAAAHTVFSGTVANRSHATLSQSFQLNASLQPDALMLLPMLEVDDPSGRRIYTAAAPVNPDQAAHVALMGYNTLGFEDMYKMGDGDLDDILAKVVGVTII
jgi:hypothetical protein